MKRVLHVLTAVTVLTCIAPWSSGAGAADLKSRMLKRAPKLAELKEQKLIGENMKGLLEVIDATKVNVEAKQLVDDENRDRSTIYQMIAKRQSSTAAKVGAQRARAIYSKAVGGVLLQREDGTWYAKK